MDERLRQFLAMESLSPAQFAETMGIQRSGISHLLAGRNKPSFEFIQKMLTAYPSLNPEWLILGKGKPYKDSAPADKKVNDVFAPAYDSSLETSLFAEDLPFGDEEMPVEETSNGKIDVIDSTSPISEPISPSVSNKRISRITIFYSDGTFEER